jgi:signal transduction histidine kinase
MSQTDHILSRPLAKPMQMRTAVFSLLAFSIIASSVVFFILSLGKPIMGVELSLQNQIWSVTGVSSAGLAYQAGIKKGDVPVEINNQPAQTFLAKYRRAGTVDQSLIKEAIFTNGQGQSIKVALRDIFPFGPALISQLSAFAVCLIFWGVGLYVFFAGRKSSPALVLGLCSLLFGLMLCANIAGLLSIPTAGQISIVIAMIGPWLFAHFFLVLPEERSGLRNNPLVHLIYLPAAITTVLFFLIGWSDGQPLPEFRYFRFIEIGGGLITVAAVVILNYFRAVSPRTRQQMKIVLAGCLAALIPFLLLYLVPQTISGQSIIPPGLSTLFFVFIPVAMGYAVVTQKLMDIDVFIRRGAIYGLITITMAVILSLATIPALLWIKSLTGPKIVVIALVLGAVATALFGPVKKGIETLVDKLFYKDRYDYRTIIQGLSSSLKNQKELTEISRLVVGTVFRTLNLAGACLFLKPSPNNYYVSATQGKFNDPNKQRQLTFLIQKRSPPIEFPNRATTVEPEVAFLIPLAAGEQEVAYLIISQKITRQAFSSDDIYLLQGVASVAAVTLRSALLAHDVSARDTFVSIASHELRAPLTSMLGYTRLLLKRERSEAQRKQWLKNVEDCGQRLSDIVDDLLNISRIQSGRLDMKVEKANLAEVLKERFILVQESDDRHEFIIDIEPNLPSPSVDRAKFGLIMGNLLSNAIKYSPNGGRITLAAKYDYRNQQVVASVADQGIGIGPQDKNMLFRTFHRIDRPETRGIKGVGLGLYIVKEWTEAMGGKVWLESELNKGSTFFVAVPVK